MLLTTVFLLVIHIPLSIFNTGIHSKHNDCLWGVDYNEGLSSLI